MSDFGLVQITRQRIRPSVVNSVSKVCPMCGGSGSVVTRDTIVTDIESWISTFRSTSDFRAVDLYINPYLKSFLERGFFNLRWRWMIKYRLKICLVADESVSLNEFKATLAGSDIDITEVVQQGESVDEIIEKAHIELQELESTDVEKRDVEYYSKGSENGSYENKGKRPNRRQPQNS